jgi:hypothetical protein
MLGDITTTLAIVRIVVNRQRACCVPFLCPRPNHSELTRHQQGLARQCETGIQSPLGFGDAKSELLEHARLVSSAVIDAARLGAVRYKEVGSFSSSKK